jgi:hypothetical protein
MTIRFVMSVCAPPPPPHARWSIRVEQLAFHWTDLPFKFLLGTFTKICLLDSSLVKIGQKDILREGLCTCMSVYRCVRDKYKKYDTTRGVEETVDELNTIWHHTVTIYMPSNQCQFRKQHNETFVR